MRLTNYEINSIKEVFKEIFKDGKIYLFGSRVDDAKKGGDIDLYIQCTDKQNILEKKIDFLVNLKQKIGDQKIDVVISKDTSRVIEQKALEDGIVLNNDNLKLDKYINECEKHIIRIEKSYNKIKNIFPLSAKKYENIQDEEIEAMDQYLFRFAKLQDTMGEKLFRVITKQYVEDVDKLTFIDMLNHLEKVGVLENANDWKILRDVRNDITHQYDDEAEEMAESLNNIFAQKDILIDIYNRIKQHVEVKLYNGIE